MKTAIITGASRGIGAEITRLFAENGYNVVLNYNHSEKEALLLESELNKKGFSVLAVKANVSIFSEAQKLVEATVKAFGTVDVLVNNAGVSQIKILIDTSEEDYQNIFDINIKSVINMCKIVAPIMTSERNGKIINISSIWGQIGASCESLYSASKAAVIGFSKALSKELGPSNINVNVVAPGYIETEMNASIDEKTKESIVNETSLCRLGTTRDIAEMVFFLASDRSSFVTGQVIGVNGGWLN
ncbi:MAG: 3-oxoacyl-ACP reductase FabG [Clostridia bacterium]